MSAEEAKDAKTSERLESIFTDQPLIMDTSLIYKPVDTNAILIFIFFVHLFLIAINLWVMFVFDIFALYFLFQIIRANTERHYQAIIKFNEEIIDLKKQVKKLSEK